MIKFRNLQLCFHMIKCVVESRKYSLLAEGAFFVDFDMVQLERRHSPAGTYNLAEH